MYNKKYNNVTFILNRLITCLHTTFATLNFQKFNIYLRKFFLYFDYLSDSFNISIIFLLFINLNWTKSLFSSLLNTADNNTDSEQRKLIISIKCLLSLLKAWNKTN